MLAMASNITLLLTRENLLWVPTTHPNNAKNEQVGTPKQDYKVITMALHTRRLYTDMMHTTNIFLHMMTALMTGAG